MAGFVKFQTPKELSEKIYEAVTVAKTTGKIVKGVNFVDVHRITE